MIETDIHKIFYLIKNNKHKIITFTNNNEFMNINNKNEYNDALVYISNIYNTYK